MKKIVLTISAYVSFLCVAGPLEELEELEEFATHQAINMHDLQVITPELRELYISEGIIPPAAPSHYQPAPSAPIEPSPASPVAGEPDLLDEIATSAANAWASFIALFES